MNETTSNQPTQAGPPKVGQVWFTARGGKATIASIDGRRVSYADGSWDWLRTFGADPEYILAVDAPPIAPPTPAPARAVEVGQRFRTSAGTTATIASQDTERTRMVEWSDAPGYLKQVSMIAIDIWLKEGKWTLLSDAPATSEPGRAEKYGGQNIGKPVFDEASETKSWLTLVMEDAADCTDCIGAKFCSRHLVMYNREATRKPCGCYPNEDCYRCRSPQAGQATCDLGGPLGHCGHVACAVERDQKAAPPAQEAAKAEPKCSMAGKPGHVKCDGTVARRILASKAIEPHEPKLYCELAMRHWEIRAFHNTGGSGFPCLAAERLPRPRLTHSAMWADECEDVS